MAFNMGSEATTHHQDASLQTDIPWAVSLCLERFRDIINSKSESLREKSTAVTLKAKFKLWCRTTGAHRPSGTRSLEYRLRDASFLRRYVIRLLRDMLTYLEQVSILNTTGSESEAGTVQGSESPVDQELRRYFQKDAPGSEVDQILESIGHVITCMLRLAVAMRNPAPHDQFQSRATIEDSEGYEQWDTARILDKYPGIDQFLAQRLGRAMARRRQYFKYREHHVARLAEGLEEDGHVEDVEDSTVASCLPKALERLKVDVGIEEMLADDDGRSEVSGTSYALSELMGPDEPRIPAIPEAHDDGYFECPFCHGILSVDARIEWKKHVFKDLRPYTCLIESCPTPEAMYSRRREWERHMQQEHWRSWRCTLGCTDIVFESSRAFHEHTSSRHEQEVPATMKATLEVLSSVPDAGAPKGKCPFCTSFDIDSGRQYISHVGRHLQQLSIFALPSIDEQGSSDEEDGENTSDSSGNPEVGEANSKVTQEHAAKAGRAVNTFLWGALVKPIDPPGLYTIWDPDIEGEQSATETKLNKRK